MDIYCKHSGNPFRIRVHGPNTSLELMLITLSAYTLNKLSLIPFMEDVELV